MAAITPVIRVLIGAKALFYHLIFFAFGPLGCLVIFCFENCTFIRNAGFMPSCGPLLPVFIVQTTAAILTSIPTIIVLRERIGAMASDDPPSEYLDLYPLLLGWLMVFSRSLIIAVRYATTNKGHMASTSAFDHSKDYLNNALIFRAWIRLPPNIVLDEIEKAMVRIGSTDKFFVFKTLTPLYP